MFANNEDGSFGKEGGGKKKAVKSLLGKGVPIACWGKKAKRAFGAINWGQEKEKPCWGRRENVKETKSEWVSIRPRKTYLKNGKNRNHRGNPPETHPTPKEKEGGEKDRDGLLSRLMQE